MWELQALVEFMYRGEVYVEQQQLEKLMQAADALQVSASRAQTLIVTKNFTRISKTISIARLALKKLVACDFNVQSYIWR